ncbi:MAG: TRAP transporter TatT component family protein, partial [Spirochaetaceae bacterium]|nr:TRAP transporter TatT component family protein [Spirochaetaceae bacterium]
ASAFIDGPASFLPDERYLEKKEAVDRAAALYRRAFRLLSAALERRCPGIIEAAVDGQADYSRFKKADVPLLYWTAVSVLAGFGLDPLDFHAARHLGAASAFLARAAELDPGWNKGAIWELYVTYYASMPPYLGGDPAKAIDAYEKTVSYSKGVSPSIYVTYATAICVPNDDYDGYKSSLERALAIDPDADPDARLATALAQGRARRLLEGASKYFILPEGEYQP